MIKRADNISRMPYLGSTKIKQAWLGNTLVYPETLYGLRSFANLGNVDYYWDMGDGIHFCTSIWASTDNNIYHYQENRDDALVYTNHNSYMYPMGIDGFFTVNGALKRIDSNDNIEDWTLYVDGAESDLKVWELMKGGTTNYRDYSSYARIQISSSTDASKYYKVELDYQNRTITRDTMNWTMSPYFVSTNKVPWLPTDHNEYTFEDYRFYDNGTAYGVGDYSPGLMEISAVLKNSLGNYISWGWVGKLNGLYYAIGAGTLGNYRPVTLYKLQAESGTWTTETLLDITEYGSHGFPWQTININGEDMLYINCLSSSSSAHRLVEGVSYLLRIVNGQPVVKKFTNNPYQTITQIPGQNMFVATNYSVTGIQNPVVKYTDRYLVRFDNNLDFELVETLSPYNNEVYTESNPSLLPVWKFGNKAYLFGKPYKYMTEPEPKYDEEYFTIKALESGDIEINNSVSGIEYSTDNGHTWDTYNLYPINVSNGDKVMFRLNGSFISPTDLSQYGIGTFTSTCRCKAYGNILSLFYRDRFIGEYYIDGNKSKYFQKLFYSWTNLVEAENIILPITDFKGNNNLYYRMFAGTSITKAPQLPATQLYDSCYSRMFQGCTNLTEAPELPATTLDRYCYYNMFNGCTSLTTAPQLPATRLTEFCYQGMFDGCSSLNNITCLATSIAATNCTTNWVRNVAVSGTFTKAASMRSWPRGVDGIPSSWTITDYQ